VSIQSSVSLLISGIRIPPIAFANDVLPATGLRVRPYVGPAVAHRLQHVPFSRLRQPLQHLPTRRRLPGDNVVVGRPLFERPQLRVVDVNQRVKVRARVPIHRMRVLDAVRSRRPSESDSSFLWNGFRLFPFESSVNAR